MEEKNGLPIISFATQAQFETWLKKNADNDAGLWIKLGKKANPEPSITYAEALDVALCYGWIDGLVNSYDADWYLQRFTPRRSKSKWSQVNREHIKRLTKDGRMRPAGLAAVEAAKADGRWDAAYASPSKITVPGDLQAALDANPAAAKAFAGLDSANRYAILYRIHDVKRTETRARKIREYVEMLEAGDTVHPVVKTAWPKGVGQPAIRALNGAGYRKLEDLKGVDLESLEGLHGMGPKALGVLKEALRRQPGPDSHPTD